MSDMFKTQVQETGRGSTLGMSLDEVLEDVYDLGISPADCVLSGSSLVYTVRRDLPTQVDTLELRSEQERAIVRTALKRLIRVEFSASTAEVATDILSRLGDHS